MNSHGGEAGIRTLVTGFTGKTVFETAAFNRSATSPQGENRGKSFQLLHDASLSGLLKRVILQQVREQRGCPALPCQNLPIPLTRDSHRFLR